MNPRFHLVYKLGAGSTKGFGLFDGGSGEGVPDGDMRNQRGNRDESNGSGTGERKPGPACWSGLIIALLGQGGTLCRARAGGHVEQVVAHSMLRFFVLKRVVVDHNHLIIIIF